MAHTHLLHPSYTPTGLFHQLAVRFSSVHAVGCVPDVYRHAALLFTAKGTEFVMEEVGLSSCIIFSVVLTAGEFREAWSHISTIVAAVISEHWSRQIGYKLAPRCPCVHHGQAQQAPADLEGGIHTIETEGFGRPLPAILRCSFMPGDAVDVDGAKVRWWYAGGEAEEAAGVPDGKVVEMGG